MRLFSSKREGTWNFKAYTFLSLPSNTTSNDPSMLYEVTKKFKILLRYTADNNFFFTLTVYLSCGLFLFCSRASSPTAGCQMVLYTWWP